MGLKCLFVSTNEVETPYPVYPLGAAHLAGALTAAGHHVTHFDQLAEGGVKKLAEQLRVDPPDLVAVSIRNIDTVDSACPDSFHMDALHTIKTVRQHSSAAVVVGGPAFSLLPDEFMDLLRPDYGVIGEGEEVLCWIADQLVSGNPPQEKIFRGPVSDSPWQHPVTYSDKVASYYLKRGGMLNVQTKRGCPFRCAYCSYPGLEGRKLRLRDPREVAYEVARLTREYGARYIFFADSVFNDPHGHYLEVAEALVKNGNKTPWCAFFRPQDLTRETLALLKRAGLAAMELGTDAASDQTLAGMNKGFSFHDVRETNENAVAEGIPASHFVIFGGPNEDEVSFAEGLRNLDTLSRTVVFAFTGVRVLPNTAVYDRAIDEGILSPDAALLDPVFYFSPGISPEKLHHDLACAWEGRLDRIYPIASMSDRVKRLHQSGFAGPLWDLLIRT